MIKRNKLLGKNESVERNYPVGSIKYSFILLIFRVRFFDRFQGSPLLLFYYF